MSNAQMKTHNESQKQGYQIEDYIRSHYYEDIPGNTYTSKFDAQTINGIPVQIKGKKTKTLEDRISIELGSINRLHKTEDSFIMDITCYQDGRTGERMIFYINSSTWNSFIPDGIETLLAYDNVFKGISNDCNKAIWDDRREQITKEYYELNPNTIFKLHLKCDHHSQRRIQASIKIKDLKNISDSYEITHESFKVSPGKRKRNKNQATHPTIHEI